jgi:photosystem II stability/assembly factor-like uncharacterized protein
MILTTLICILSTTLAPNPADVYILTDLAHARAMEQIEQGIPIYSYAYGTAVYLTSAGNTPPVAATVIAQGINPRRIAIIWIQGNNPSGLPTPEYEGQFNVLYKQEHLLIIDADAVGQDVLRRAGYEVTPLPKRALLPARAAQIPRAPEGWDIVHASIRNITPEKMMSYDQTLANFISRFTFDNRLLDAQDWSSGIFNSWLLSPTQFDYNSLGSVMHYYGIKQDAELASYFGFVYRKANDAWVTYHANIMVLDSKYSSDGSYLYLCGRGGLIGWNTSPNDYTNWTIKNTGTDKDLYGIYVEGQSIWATGKNGTFVYSDDGGDTWQVIPTATTTDTMEEVGRFHVGTGSEQKYLAVGGGGTILRSDDGISWTRLTNLPISGAWLRDVTGYDNPGAGNRGEIMVCGADDAILTSTDGGDSWDLRMSGTIATWMHGAHHAGKSWVEGTGGHVATSDDYGQTWVYHNILTGSLLTNISFDSIGNPNTSYICGQYNAYNKTDDGGVTWQPLSQPESNYQSRDIIGELLGTKYPDDIIIVCAHQDSISDNPYLAAPGADDNGSGSAAVMAIAEQMSRMQFEHTVRFILWSGEEQGLLGSTAYANWAAENNQNIIAVLNADMIGYKDDAINDFDLIVTTVGEDLQDFIAATAQYYLPQIPVHVVVGGSGGSDHAPFSDNGYQATLLIEHEEEEWYPWYHSQEDLPEHLSADLMAAGTKILLASAMEIAVPIGGRKGLAAGKPYAYPNPLHIDQGWRQITFANLAPGATIKLYGINGDLLWHDTANNDNLIWDNPNLASGVYLYSIEQNGFKYRGKLAVIK